MIFKSIKFIVIAGVGMTLAGAVLFGTELGSYLTSSVRSVRSSVNDNVPVEFQIKRARDMLHDIVPEMHANIRLVAQQEVELAHLKTDIGSSEKAMMAEQNRLQRFRNTLTTTQASYNVSGITYSREQLKDELARSFERYKEAEMVLAGKRRLLENREKSLAAAMQMLDRTRSQKTLLESQISGLEAQFRMVQANSVGSKVHIDNSKLAQTEKLIAQIKKQLDTSERVLALEGRFTHEIPVVDPVDEAHLMAEIDEHFAASSPATITLAPGASPAPMSRE